MKGEDRMHTVTVHYKHTGDLVYQKSHNQMREAVRDLETHIQLMGELRFKVELKSA